MVHFRRKNVATVIIEPSINCIDILSEEERNEVRERRERGNSGRR